MYLWIFYKNTKVTYKVYATKQYCLNQIEDDLNIPTKKL